METFLEMEVQVRDPDDMAVVWRGPAWELLQSNDQDPEVENALQRLQEGASTVLICGGAVPVWLLERADG